jgi:hypothetical protein
MTRLFTALKAWHDARPAWLRKIVLYPLAGSVTALVYLIVAFVTSALAFVRLPFPYSIAGIPIVFFWVMLGTWIASAIVTHFDL